MNLTKRQIETLKKLSCYDCVRSTNRIGMDLPDMAHCGTVKALERLGLADFVFKKYQNPFHPDKFQYGWTGNRITEKGKEVLRQSKEE